MGQYGAYRVALGVGTAAGGVASLANPEGVDLYITRLVLDITDPSDAASTLDAGTAANGSTSSDNLIDGLSGASAGAFDNLKNGGSNGKAGQRWESDQYVTISQASGAVEGMAGAVYIEYIRLG